ncbi:motility protein A [Desulfoplanes sp. PS50]
MDIATLFGIIIGFALVIGAIFLGGSTSVFINVPGMMIVLGGSFAATCVNFPLGEILQSVKAAIKIFTSRKTTTNEMVNIMVRIADISRREGLLALENIKTKNPFLKKACLLIADNADSTLIRDALKIEITSMKKRHAISQDVFKKMAIYSPSFGMIGTLIGLVQMLSRLSDPSAIGPAMAVALLTTFYGTIMSTLIFQPLAGKLRSRSLQENLHLEIIFEGAKCILENNNPRIVYEKLSSFVPPQERRYDR